MANLQKAFKLGRAWRCEAARHLEGLSRAERVVLKELAYRGNERGYCYPSYKQLAKWTGYSSKTIQRAIAALEQKQLIRRRRFVRADGSHAVYGIALTIPLPVLGDGHSRPKKGDTESSHKLYYEIKKKDYSDRYRELEDELLKRFDRLIDWKKPPNLICLYEVTSWVLKHAGLQWGEIRSQVLEAAKQLESHLTRNSDMLVSWEQLVSELTPGALGGAANELGSRKESVQAKGKQLLENLSCLGLGISEDLVFNRILAEFRSEKTCTQITLVTSSPSTAHRLVQDYRKILTARSHAENRNVIVLCNCSIVFVFTRNS